METVGESQKVSKSRAVPILATCLGASLLLNAFLIGKSSFAASKPPKEVKHDDIEVRATVKSTRNVFDSTPYTFEGTITNTSKTDAAEVLIQAHYSNFVAKSGTDFVSGEFVQGYPSFKNLKAGETRAFTFITAKQVPKFFVKGDTENMRGDTYVQADTPKLDWLIATTGKIEIK